jgi:hypothetical protein
MIYKKEEFKAFLKLIREGQAYTWVAVAEALGVDQDTITAWKNTDEGRKAIADGIQNALKEMEDAGKKDWRMWESKLKMLGVNPSVKVDSKHSLADPVEAVLRKFGFLGEEDAGETKESEGKTSQSDT